MKRIFCIFPAVLLCMSLVMAPAVSVYAAEDDFSDTEIILQNLKYIVDSSEKITMSDLNGDSGASEFFAPYYMYCMNDSGLGLTGCFSAQTGRLDSSVSFCVPVTYNDMRDLYTVNFNLYVEGSYGLVGTFDFNGSSDILYNSGSHALSFLHEEKRYFLMSRGNSFLYIVLQSDSEGNIGYENPVSICQTYYRQGYTSSYFNGYSYAVEEGLYYPTPEPDPPVTPSEPVDILDMANVALLFSVSILTAVSDNPFLAFILAGSLVTVCVYVLRQLKIVTSN